MVKTTMMVILKMKIQSAAVTLIIFMIIYIGLILI